MPEPRMNDQETADFLAHFGVKGMRWGKRSASNTSGSTNSSRRGTKEITKGEVKRAVDAKAELSTKAPKTKVTNQQIKDARIRESARIDRVNQHANDLNLQTSDRGRAAAAKVYQKSVDAYINSPDGPTAAKMTTGEKITAGFGVAIMGAAAATLIIK